MEQENWEVVRLPAIAEQDETHIIETPFRSRTFLRRAGEALHPAREPVEVLAGIRRTLGEYHLAGQYQQAPAPLGGGLVKLEWFNYYTPAEVPLPFDLIFQSWDTANKSSELNDYSVCTTWGYKSKKLYLLDVLRERYDYPRLKRAVRNHAQRFKAGNILIEDAASGTQLIQELIREGVYGIARYKPTADKILRMYSASTAIANGYVYLPKQARWLDQYIHELITFHAGKHDDQVDSTSQALEWIKNRFPVYGLLEYLQRQTLKQSSSPEPHLREAGTVNNGQEEYIAIHKITGQRIGWDGHDWVDCNTGIPVTNDRNDVWDVMKFKHPTSTSVP